MSNQYQPNSSTRLLIAVLGAGGIGSAFAFQLATRGRHDVTAIARPCSTRLAQMQTDDGIVNAKGEHANVHVCDALDAQIAYDVVIVTLQAHRVAAVMPALQRSAAKCILFMFNNFEPERLGKAAGADRCCFGMPFIQATVGRDGRLDATIRARGPSTRIGQQRWVEVFNDAGLPAVFEADMPLWLRCHVPLCIAFESVSVAGVRRGRGASWAQAMTIARGTQECFALIQGLGYTLYPSGKARLNASPTCVMAAIFWFMSRIKSFRELLATGADECSALVDVLIAAAIRARPAVRVARIEAMKPAALPGSRPL
jgi:2-dehydropantoate 2-reductase